jgi:molybdopterin converting factor small subunit
MTVIVKLFALAKELAGRGELAVDVPAGATLADLRRTIAREHPALENVLAHSLWAVDAGYADDSTRLTEQSRVALIPPVSGG